MRPFLEFYICRAVCNNPQSQSTAESCAGISCSLLSLLILSVSSVLVVRRYRAGKTYQLELEQEM